MNTNQYDQILKKYPPKREYLIQMLHDIQHHSGRNFISTDALKEIVSYTRLSMAAVQGMVEYYSMFSATPRGKYLIRVCKSPVCINHDAEQIISILLSYFGLQHLSDVTSDGSVSIETSECLGKCGDVTSVSINTWYLENVTPENIIALTEQYIKSHPDG
jgi:NADH-quinone oxidoreductase subunit E